MRSDTRVIKTHTKNCNRGVRCTQGSEQEERRGGKAQRGDRAGLRHPRRVLPDYRPLTSICLILRSWGAVPSLLQHQELLGSTVSSSWPWHELESEFAENSGSVNLAMEMNEP